MEMKKIFKYITIGILLIGMSGCMFSMSRMRSVVLTKEDVVYGTIPGVAYKIINMDGKPEILSFEQDMYIVSAASLVGAEQRKNKRFFKRVRITKRNSIAGGSIIAILGIILQVMKLKKKIDKGEEIGVSDILNVFKFRKKKKK